MPTLEVVMALFAIGSSIGSAIWVVSSVNAKVETVVERLKDHDSRIHTNAQKIANLRGQLGLNGE